MGLLLPSRLLRTYDSVLRACDEPVGEDTVVVDLDHVCRWEKVCQFTAHGSSPCMDDEKRSLIKSVSDPGRDRLHSPEDPF